MKYAIHLLLLGLLLVPAAAAEGELVTWSSLGTYGGGNVLPPAPGQGRACHDRRTR